MFRSRGECHRLPEAKVETKVQGGFDCYLCDEGGWCSETDVAIHSDNNHLDVLFNFTKRHTPENPVCFTCIKRFNSPSAFLLHFKTKHLYMSPQSTRIEHNIYICNHCNNIFFNKKLLEVHIMYKHFRTKNRITCPVCFKKLQRITLWNHFLAHQLKSVSTCPICLMKCTNRTSLISHIKQVHCRNFVCNVCQLVMSRLDLFHKHCEGCNTKVIKDLKIGDCTKYFLTPQKALNKKCCSTSRCALKGLKIYNDIHICVLCREICTTHLEMSVHIEKTHGEIVHETKMHRCPCGEKFNKAILLKHHLLKIKHKNTVDVPDVTPTKMEE